MKYKPNKNNTCAVIVAYHPDNEFPERVERISKQVGKVIVVDNGSSENCVVMLNKLSEDKKVDLILNNKNLGVATALNIGLRFAINLDKGFSWCLTMDQDTIVYPELLEVLISAYTHCPFRRDVAIVGSNYEEWTTGRILFNADTDGQKWAEVDHLPTSGCLTSIEVYKSVGGFRDDFFIDYVDTEFCIRIKENGYRIIIAPKVCMRHPLGYYRKNKLYKILCGRSMVSNYPPVRHYYWSRNGMVLAREYTWRETRWAIGQIYYILIKRSLAVILFEDEKLSKIRNIFLGFFHSLLKIFPKQE